MKTCHPFVARRRAIVLIELNLIIISGIGFSIIKKIYLSKKERLNDLPTKED